jgi:N-acetylmuramoyl-L-alanine amidase
MRQMQRYMVLFFVAAMVAAILLLPSVTGDLSAMQTPKGTIVIDAGHGGFDGGATGRATGIPEDGINLAVAKKLQSLFEKNGYEVIMTREDENAVGDNKDEDMARRREIIASSGADIVISIHMNKFPSASVSGPQVFYYEKSTEGEELAKLIQQELIEALDPPKQRVEHPEDYYILCSGDCPAVIVECGFLSNEREEALLITDEYQAECAKAIYRGADAYLEQRTQSEDAGDFHYPL